MKNIILVLIVAIFGFSESKFSDPQPSFDNPRKVVFQLYDSDIKKVNHNLSSIYNILKEYPSETLQVAVVAYGNGMRALRKDYDKATLTRMMSLMEYDVEFVACKNTMETMKWTKDEFIDDLNYVQAGIVDLIEKETAGYVGLIAY